MSCFVAPMLLLFAGIVSAQAPQIRPGATVYIEPMNGYETYLAAAFAKKQLPLIVVTDKAKADYIITSTISQRAPSQPAVVVNNTNVNNGNSDAYALGVQQAEEERARRTALGSTSASISVVDVHSSQVIFAYSVGKGRNTNQLQSTAEACAKHLKESIMKPKK